MDLSTVVVKLDSVECEGESAVGFHYDIVQSVLAAMAVDAPI
jgi:hypothetical protein